MSGGDSSQLWLPFFETDLKDTTRDVGIFVLVYFIALAVSSCLLLAAVFTYVRGLFLPWFCQMVFVILFQVIEGSNYDNLARK
jgi:hypothetical protein